MTDKIVKIEISFPVGVELPMGFEQRLSDLIDTVCRKYEAENPDRVMWPAGHGCKVLWREPQEPDFDPSVYEITVAEREAYEDERRRRRMEGARPDFDSLEELFGQIAGALEAAKNGRHDRVSMYLERAHAWRHDLPLEVAALVKRINELDRLLNRPYIADFIEALKREAAHQKIRWGEEHDLQKNHEQMATVVHALTSKAVLAFWDRKPEKVLHHLITAGAALANWHAKLLDQPHLLELAEAHDARSHEEG